MISLAHDNAPSIRPPLPCGVQRIYEGALRYSVERCFISRPRVLQTEQAYRATTAPPAMGAITNEMVSTVGVIVKWRSILTTLLGISTDALA